jgi:capsular polysaccharide export protein
MPFYAGWGLSEDMHMCNRRTRKLSINELSVGVYILYPKYIHPQTKQQCEIESLLEYLETRLH